MGVPINNVSRRVVYAASGTGPYAFTFEILAAADIAVYKDDTLLTLTTDYTVTINANGTGSITLTASPTGATQIAIVGNRTIQRLTDFVTGGDLFANTINDELDQQTIFAQQNAEGLQRALQAPQTDPTTINMTLPRASVRASKVLSFDASGNPSATEFIGSNRGNWASGTLYYVRDIVKDTSTSNIWQCLVQHTSSGSQPLSTNTDSAKWFLLVDAASAGASASAAAASASAAASSASAASTSASNASSSASSAASSASAASTSASNASTSATNAASSASTASTQASNASTSATNAATSATSASNSASTATTQATNASNSASSASTSATNAANSASSASSSASSASSSASSASTSASNAASSATAAAASATSAAASYDSFDDRYLGAKTSDPTLDNDGNALLTGALYFNSSTGEMKVYSGSAWVSSFLTAGAQTISGVKTFASNPILDAGTANGVAYLNGSKVLTTGSALTFDGTTFAVNSAASIGASTAKTKFYSDSVYNGIFNGASLGSNESIYMGGGMQFFFASGSEQMRLTSTGLGIGTSSPAFKLDVNGNANIGSTSSVDTALFVKSSTVTGLVGAQSNYSAWSSGGLTTAMNIGTTTNNGISFGTNNIGRLNLDSAGNLGLGVTPSAWASGGKPLQAVNASFWGLVGTATFSSVGANYFYDGAYKYISNGVASDYYQLNGAHGWRTAASGTAGDPISFTQAMTLDASGNLLVGTTSSIDNNIKVQLATDGTNTQRFFGVNNNTGYGIIFGFVNNTEGNVRTVGAYPLTFGTNNTERARITSGGNLLVGTTVDIQQLSMKRNTSIGWVNAANNGSDQIIYADSSSNLQFYTAATERARITSGGDLLVGTTSSFSGTSFYQAGSGIYVSYFRQAHASNPLGLVVNYSGASPNGTANAFFEGNDTTTARVVLRSNGGIANYSANNVNLSDRREKTNFAPAKSYLDTICAIPVQTFNYIDQSEDDPGLTLGVVAQDVQAVAPELVMESNWGTAEDPKMRLSIYQTDLQYALMKCIQEQQAIITDLRARVAQLEAK